MAKLKTAENIDTPPTPDTTSDTSRMQEQHASAPKTKDERDKAADRVQAVSELPACVTAILKTFRAYSQLYIDSHGGAYNSPDTPEKLRIGAQLYKNPFYEP